MILLAEVGPRGFSYAEFNVPCLKAFYSYVSIRGEVKAVCAMLVLVTMWVVQDEDGGRLHSDFPLPLHRGYSLAFLVRLTANELGSGRPATALCGGAAGDERASTFIDQSTAHAGSKLIHHIMDRIGRCMSGN